MPKRFRTDRNAVALDYATTRNAAETARRLGLHPNTVYQILKALKGQCRRCPNTAVLGSSYCKPCLEWVRDNMARRRRQRIRDGVCMECDEPRHVGSRLYCPTHRVAHLESSARDHAKNSSARAARYGAPTDKERRRMLRAMYGLEAEAVWIEMKGKCALCGVPHAERAVHIHHLDKNKQNSVKANMTLLCQHCHRLTHSMLQHPNPKFALRWMRKTYPSAGW